MTDSSVPAAAPLGNRGVRWLAGHPVLALVVWFFTVGQAIAFTPVIASSIGAHLPEQPFTVASTWLGLLLPAVAITWLVDGPTKTRALLKRLTAVRRPVRWYVLCLAVVPLTSLAITTATLGVPVVASPSDLLHACLLGFGLQTAWHLVTNNLWEELAWTGFVQARLQSSHSPMVAAVLTAPLFALQHSPLIFDNTLVAGVLVMAALIALAVPFRVVMAWIFNRTGSLFLVGLAHACGNAVVTSTAVGDALVPALYGRNLGPIHLFAFALIGIVVAVLTRGRLGIDNSIRTTAPASGLFREARHGA
jgi:membrane protease YdiL (CAAX protease family)